MGFNILSFYIQDIQLNSARYHSTFNYFLGDA